MIRFAKNLALRTIGAIHEITDVKTNGQENSLHREPIPDSISLEFMISSLKNEIDILHRKNTWYFSRIESINAERDKWRNFCLAEMQGHQKALLIYEESIQSIRIAILNAIEIINSYRSKEGLDKIPAPFDSLKSFPSGKYLEYEELVRKLLSEIPWPPKDWIGERNYISVHGKEPRICEGCGQIRHEST